MIKNVKKIQLSKKKNEKIKTGNITIETKREFVD